MYFSELTTRINQKLGDDSRSATDLVGFIDAVIDDINSKLDAKFPTFSEIARGFVEKTTDLTELLNKKLGNNSVDAVNLVEVIDGIIADINSEKGTNYATFSDIAEDIVSDDLESATEIDFNYNYFPDKYLRSVVVVGTALKVYEVDEEGNQTAMMFKYDYDQQLFYMLRDYGFKVPEQFQNNEDNVLGFSNEKIGTPGMTVYGKVFR